MEKSQHKILLIGAGLMAPPLIAHLCSFNDSQITIAANIKEDAEKCAQYDPKQLKGVYLDISDEFALTSLVKEHDLVISFIPPFLHHLVANVCLEQGVNMTTSSYIAPAVAEMGDKVKEKGLIFLNECGLDPGIDIMGTMKVVHQAQKEGKIVKSYESYCGGIPVAEQADENPLGYKFSWNPGAAIKASRNTATFRRGGKKVTLPEPLKDVQQRDDFSMSMKLETYPNRDSLSFMETFGMHDCDTFIRGTLRFKGFSSIIAAFHDLGLTSDDKMSVDIKTLTQMLQDRAAIGKIRNESKQIDEVVQFFCLQDADKLKKHEQLMKDTLARVDMSYLDEGSHQEVMRNILKTLNFLGFFDASGNEVATAEQSFLDTLSNVMQKHLNLNEHDRDLVVMRHDFELWEYFKGAGDGPSQVSRKKIKHTSTMVASGKSKADGGPTIMSKTVGVTCAIATRLVLEGKISMRGVLSPIHPEIYNPILEQLAEQGIRMKDDAQVVAIESGLSAADAPHFKADS